MVTSLEALRRIYIERDENTFLSRLFDLSDSNTRLCLRLGALSFFQVGQLLPEQLKTFHNATHIFPVSSQVTAVYLHILRAVYSSCFVNINRSRMDTMCRGGFGRQLMQGSGSFTIVRSRTSIIGQSLLSPMMRKVMKETPQQVR